MSAEAYRSKLVSLCVALGIDPDATPGQQMEQAIKIAIAARLTDAACQKRLEAETQATMLAADNKKLVARFNAEQRECWRLMDKCREAEKLVNSLESEKTNAYIYESRAEKFCAERDDALQKVRELEDDLARAQRRNEELRLMNDTLHKLVANKQVAA